MGVAVGARLSGFIASRDCNQGLHATSDTSMPDAFERRFPVNSELVGRQLFQDLAETMRPNPLPPLARILETQVKFVYANIDMGKPGSANHLL